MQMPRRMRGNAGPQPFAQLFRPQRHVGESFKQRSQVKARTNGENRQPLSRAEIFEHGNGPLAIISRSRRFPRLQHINQMMRHSLPLFSRGLRRADIKPTIKLSGIASHHFAAKLSSEPNSKRRFYRSGWSNDANERRLG